MMTLEKLYITFLAQGQKVTTDTRKIEPGQIFFALKGSNFDGNQYAMEAIKQGAKYAVVDDRSLEGKSGIILVDDVLKTLQELALFHRRKLNIPLIAITGSNGKTTSKELIREVLAMKFKVACTKGNLNNHIGIPLTLLDIKAYEDISIVEMGANHQGEIADYCGYTEPNYGVITNIGKAHLEGFGGLEGVIKGKTELFRYLIQNPNSKIFINSDDSVLMNHKNGLFYIPYGTQEDMPIYGRLDNSESDFLTVRVFDGDTDYIIRTNLTGDYNLYNVLLAYTIGRYFEVDSKKIVQALEAYQPSNSRSQVLKRDQLTIILDAYNANPSSMEVALNNLSKFAGKKTAILGAMKELGEFTEAEHKKILDLALALKIDYIVAVGPEFADVLPSSKILFFDTTDQAKQWFKGETSGQGTILIKGSRGMALEKLLE
jgi:UDP-N-acetylmuramoyl-tripeptide--D-alanyl-D-alanine ligase